jgi:hypothetical protein
MGSRGVLSPGDSRIGASPKTQISVLSARRSFLVFARFPTSRLPVICLKSSSTPTVWAGLLTHQKTPDTGNRRKRHGVDHGNRIRKFGIFVFRWPELPRRVAQIGPELPGMRGGGSRDHPLDRISRGICENAAKLHRSEHRQYLKDHRQSVRREARLRLLEKLADLKRQIRHRQVMSKPRVDIDSCGPRVLVA